MTNNNAEKRNGKFYHLMEKSELWRQVEDVVNTTPVIDIHTHLFPPEFGEMNLFGIDELLTYHYLVAETFRSSKIAYGEFWGMNKKAQADLVWRTLFLENTPLSEAARGVITVLKAFGLNPNASDLTEARRFFRSLDMSEHLDRVFKLAGVGGVVMTNDPFDDFEAGCWENIIDLDPRFHAALRMDRLINDWENTSLKLAGAGYKTDLALNDRTIAELRRFFDKWIEIMKPLYMAVSLPDDFKFPAADARDQIIREIVFPIALEHDLPFNVMIGVRRGVNPDLRGAGDGVGRADVGALERMCSQNPDVEFMATFLSRENQHELCVAARKFKNLMPFGCWWFLNNPSIIAEITSERLELLGTSFIPQHSDARILEQLIYKWQHSRAVIAEALFKSYEPLLASGRIITRQNIERDVARMFSGNFRELVNLAPAESDLQTI